MSTIEIRPVQISAENLDMLTRMLVDVVALGGSVSFMHPLANKDAAEFWEKWLQAAARDESVVLGAFDGPVLVSTVTLLLDMAPNQPHRAEIAKMMTLAEYRGRGIAKRLMVEAERIARGRARMLLVLDTAADEGAAGLYEKLGFTLAGEIPDFALKPHGGLSGTLIYWKRLTSI
ncbi:GNAT family N-acetyltransferase [Mesorhizobium sp. NBSH29]|uniref:GNAT family N-acetyltransferase n=1 Tax=Mesorhizobium sp. NBSH29 TaxID=2654249 RepID=UPI001896946A|nr:GNAT family N-acetyltransferase [Mesorhizobium sp. NBSH29]QPC88157.1 GNAT family N-acetyltransferase [Mesorhizobium sp. NBSH29]